jgi:hypothetical protein
VTSIVFNTVVNNIIGTVGSTEALAHGIGHSEDFAASRSLPASPASPRYAV